MKRTSIVALMLPFLTVVSWPSFVHAVPIRERPWCDNSPRPGGWQRRITFDMDGKSWREVLEWFAYQAHLPLTCNYSLPKEPVTCVPTNDGWGRPLEYSLVEILDILNESLQNDKDSPFQLIRDGNTLRVVSADEKFVGDIPRGTLDELKEHGRTEIVEVVIRLPGLSAEDQANLKRQLGPFGQVTPLDDERYIIRSSLAAARRLLR